MSYAIIGFGSIGQALARAFARSGIEVSVAATRDPESFAADAAAIRPTVIPKTLAEAVKSDIVFLAVRFEAHPEVAKALPTWQGKNLHAPGTRSVIGAIAERPVSRGLDEGDMNPPAFFNCYKYCRRRQLATRRQIIRKSDAHRHPTFARHRF